MPRLQIDYSNTIIYKLCCNDPSITDIYVGHTTNFTNRKRSHKCRCNNETDKSYNFYVYQFIRYHGDWSNWSMIQIEKINCVDSNDAIKHERRYFELLGATLNSHCPSRTLKEYREDHTEKYKEYQKEYHEENKEKLLEQKKQYYEENKENCLEQKKQYYEDNKEQFKEINKKYREEHKEQIKKYREDNKEKSKQYREDNKEHLKEKRQLQRSLKKLNKND